MRPFSLVAAAVLSAASFAAHADTFHFSFGTTADAFSGSGTFTAISTATAGEYTITGISGTADTGGGVNRSIAQLLAPGTFPTFSNGGTVPPNDNLLFFPEAATGGYFDQDGVAFELNNGAQINLYFIPFAPSNAFLLRSNGTPVDEDVTTSVTGAAAVTPEPGSIFLLSTGLLGMAGIVRRRVRI